MAIFDVVWRGSSPLAPFAVPSPNFESNALGVTRLKNLLMPLLLMGCFPVDFQDVKRPLGTKSVKRPIKVGKRPINEGKRPIKAKVLVGVSVGSLMGCFRAPPTRRKTAPLKRPIKRSMKGDARSNSRILRLKSHEKPLLGALLRATPLIFFSLFYWSKAKKNHRGSCKFGAIRVQVLYRRNQKGDGTKGTWQKMS